MLILLGVCNQILSLIVWIAADPMQEGKAISHRNTDFGAKLNSSSCLAANHRPNLSLDQGVLEAFGGSWSAIAASSMDRRHGDRRHGPASSLRPRRCIELVKLSSILGIARVRQVNLHEAKTHLSRLVAQAVAGESFVICKAGVPLVQVTRLNDADIQAPPPRRRLGLLAGQCSVPDDFDRIASDEIADLFEGGSAQDPRASSPIEGDAR